MELRHRLGVGVAALALAVNLAADTTVRVKNTVSFGPQLPPALVAQLTATGLPGLAPETVIRIKGSAGYISGQPVSFLFDFTHQSVTLIDTAKHEYSNVALNDLSRQLAGRGGAPAAAAVAGMPPALLQQVANSLKVSVVTRSTGRTDTILGIAVAETEVVLSVDMAPAGSGTSMPVSRIVLQMWKATPSELMRHPELREWRDNMAAMNAAVNPVAALQKMLAQLPGVSQGSSDALAQLSRDNSPSLRSHTTISMPMLAQLAQMASASGAKVPAGADFDSDAPIAESTSETVEISSAPVDPASMAVPSGFESMPIDAFFKSAYPAVAGKAGGPR